MANEPGKQVQVSDVAIDPAQSNILNQAAAEIQEILDKYNLTLVPVAHIQLIPRPTEKQEAGG